MKHSTILYVLTSVCMIMHFLSEVGLIFSRIDLLNFFLKDATYVNREGVKKLWTFIKREITEKCQTFDQVCKGVCMPNDISNIY